MDDDGPATIPGEQNSGSNLQTGVIPWRRHDSRGVEILLITSTRRKRWLVPKGWPMAGLTLREAAAQEAFEEAGIRGTPAEEPLGRVTIDKLDPSGDVRFMSVELYALEVTTELTDWPEADRRQRRWHSPAEALAAVTIPSLRAMISDFCAGRTAGHE